MRFNLNKKFSIVEKYFLDCGDITSSHVSSNSIDVNDVKRLLSMSIFNKCGLELED
jgi:hypothetical protein